MVPGLVLGTLSYSLLQTIIVPSLPAVQREFGADPATATWLLTGFLLTSAVATALVSKVGEHVGLRRAYLSILAVYGAACLAAAIAPSLPVLIGARVIQGTAGALVPLSFAIVADAVPPSRIGAAMGMVSGTFAAGAVLGFTVGTVLVDVTSWRSTFVLNAVVIAVAFHWVRHRVPPTPARDGPRSIDAAGALLLSVALTSGLLAVTQGATWGWSSPPVLALTAGSVAMFAAFGLVESRRQDPLFDLSHLRRPVPLAANLAAFGAGWANYAGPALVLLLAQTPRSLPEQLRPSAGYGLDRSATSAGLLLLPASLVYLVVSTLTGDLSRRVGSSFCLKIGLLIAAAGLTSLSLESAQAPALVLGSIVTMTGIAAVMAAMPIMLTEGTTERQRGPAISANNVIRTIGTAVGAQVSAAILSARQLDGLNLPAPSAYGLAFAVAAGFALAATLAAKVLLGSPRSAHRSIGPASKTAPGAVTPPP